MSLPCLATSQSTTGSKHNSARACVLQASVRAFPMNNPPDQAPQTHVVRVQERAEPARAPAREEDLGGAPEPVRSAEVAEHGVEVAPAAEVDGLARNHHRLVRVAREGPAVAVPAPVTRAHAHPKRVLARTRLLSRGGGTEAASAAAAGQAGLCPQAWGLWAALWEQPTSMMGNVTRR